MAKKEKLHSTILDSNSEEYRAESQKAADASPKSVKAQGAKDVSSDKNKKSRTGRTVYIWSVIIISLLLSALILTKGIININEQLTAEITILETDISEVEDGTYGGKYSTAHMSAEVSVTIQSGRITFIQLESSAGIDPQRAKVVTETILRNQTVNAPDDSIGGQATDKIIQAAVMDALGNAVEESRDDDSSLIGPQQSDLPLINDTPDAAEL